MRAPLLLVLFVCLTTDCLAQVKRQRLRAQAEYEGIDTNSSGRWNLRKTDSAIFKYSGARHSLFDYNQLDHVDLRGIYKSHNSLLDQVNRIVVPNNIDSFDNCLNIPFDSMYYYGLNQSGQLALGESSAVQYYGDGYCSEYRGNNVYRGSFQTSFINYFGRLTVARYLSLFDRFFTYDVFDNVVIDSFGGNPNQVYLYDFDTKGKYTARTGYTVRQGNRDTFEHISYSYYPDGRVQTRIRNNQLDSFFYAPGVRGFVRLRGYSYSNGSISAKPIYKYETHINARGLKDTLYYSTRDSSDRRIVSLTYDSLGNPLSRTVDDFQYYGIFRTHYVKYYHYENYTPALLVGETGPAEVAVNVYPNPTTGSININCPDFKAGVPVTVCIRNVLGQTVFQESFVPNSGKGQLQLGHEVSVGTYIIEIRNDMGVLHKGKLTKQ